MAASKGKSKKPAKKVRTISTKSLSSKQAKGVRGGSTISLPAVQASNKVMGDGSVRPADLTVKTINKW
jgi:hypothetical protein